MRVTDHDVDVAAHIVDTSGIVDILTDAMRTSPRGRPQNPEPIRQLLVGLFLSVSHNGTALITKVHELLTCSISVEARLRLGVAVIDESLPEGHRNVLTLDQLKYVSRVYGKKLSVTGQGEQEAARRLDVLTSVGDAVMDVFDLGFSSGTAALDATAIWSWGRGYRTEPLHDAEDTTDDATAGDVNSDGPSNGTAPPDGHDDDKKEEADDAKEGDDQGGGDTDDDEFVRDRSGRRRRRGSSKPKKRHDPDARWSLKTGKNGEKQAFFGYEEHTLVQVPDRDDKADVEPRLIRRFSVTPAGVDVVDPSLSVIDRSPVKITTLIVDRHYSYKDPDRWWDELWDRGIEQVQDLRDDEHGFTEHDRMRLAAGDLHCPATPDDLGTIKRPAPGDATKLAVGAFKKRISTRAAYVMRRITAVDRDGKVRVQCCALAGTIGCPLRPGTVEAAIALGLPVVENPPDPNGPEGLPRCCTQTTVTTKLPAKKRKHVQKEYWGSVRWWNKWRKRTYVEGSYGNRKNSATEDLRRGQFAVVGLHWIFLVMTMTNASYNLRILRNWHARTGLGDPDHPLLAKAPQSFLVELTPEETAVHLEARRAS